MKDAYDVLIYSPLEDPPFFRFELYYIWEIETLGEYKARYNLHKAILVPEVVLDFSPREKERALSSELRDSFSPLC